MADDLALAVQKSAAAPDARFDLATLLLQHEV